MRPEENNRDYLNEVWRRVRVQEYDKYQLEKITENKKFVRRMEIKLSLLIFGSLSVISIILYFILGISMEWLIICISAFLIGAETYDYLSFNEAKRRIYYENSN